MGGNAEFETHHDSAYQLITKLQVADAALHPGQCVELLCARLAGNHFPHIHNIFMQILIVYSLLSSNCYTIIIRVLFSSTLLILVSRLRSSSVWWR